ncbi:ricin-type beta-trefoil lectin domain protein [Allokutzneria multivorans]
MMSSRFRASAAVVAVLALILGGTAQAESPVPDPTTMATTFADEFNAPAGTPVDGSKWQLETGDNVNNHERQFYTNSTSNAVHDGAGNLVITARRENPGNYQCWYGRCEYTSARLNTAGRFTQAYGRFEARMKLPRGKGMWPAFWMLGDNMGQVGWPQAGEIDIMENVGHLMNTVHGTLHGPGYSGSGGIGAAYNGPNFGDGFHTFAVDWAPNRITWYVDGNAYQTRTPADLGGRQWVFDHPFFLILNLAVGGYWPGDPDGSTVFPQQFVVDYVRVTTTSTGAPTGRITGLAGKCVDVANAGTANGTPIQLHDCNGNAAQNWTVAGDGTIRALGKCLDVNNNGANDGAAVVLWDCHGGANQKWATPDARDIVSISGNRCLDVTGNNSANGTRLQVWTCGGTENQKWNVPR